MLFWQSNPALKPVATEAEITPSGPETSASRDPRLRQSEQRPSKPADDERVVVLVDREDKGKSNGHERVPSENRHEPLAGTADRKKQRRSPQPEIAPTSVRERGPRARRKAGSSPPALEEPRGPHRGGSEEFRVARRRGGPDSRKWQREVDRGERKSRKPPDSDMPEQREAPRKRNFRGRGRNRSAGGRRRRDYDWCDGEDGRPDKPRFSDEEQRERRGGFKGRFARGPRGREDRPFPQGEPRPRHLSDEPLQKKPKPLMPEHELGNRGPRHRSPPRGRGTRPLHMLPGDFPRPEPFDFDEFEPHGRRPRPPLHPENYHQPPGVMEGPPPHHPFPEEHGDFPSPPVRNEAGPLFDIPKELLLDQQGEIARQVRLACIISTSDNHKCRTKCLLAST